VLMTSPWLRLGRGDDIIACGGRGNDIVGVMSSLFGSVA
jgi:hypothetical protein